MPSIRTHSSWLTLSGERPQSAVHADTLSILRNSENELTSLPLRDPSMFVSCGLSTCLHEWENIVDESSCVLEWLRDGVSVHKFFKHFKGNYKGKAYDSHSPPKRFFKNSQVCSKHVEFIKSELLERVQNGSLRLLGRMGECEMPHLVMPLVVEESKPRLCHGERFLNLWIENPSFQLENLKHVHRMVSKGARMISFDEKSGYDHVRLSMDSETYFGVQFAGFLFTYTTLPFGWSASPFVYQTIGMTVTSYLRSLGVFNTQYIDDRMAVESAHARETNVPGLANADCLCFAILELLT